MTLPERSKTAARAIPPDPPSPAPHLGGAVCILALLTATGCSGAKAPERCRNLVENPDWERRAAGWSLPAFARLEDAPGEQVRSIVVSEGPANGAIAQLIRRPAALSSSGVVAVGYARVETAHSFAPTDEDITAQLWDGTVNVVNAYSKNGRDFPGPYARLRFSGREAASGCWKRFVTETVPAARGRFLYPHYAFWGARIAPGVRLHLWPLSLVEAPLDEAGDPESWLACPNLPVPAPALVSSARRQWDQGLPPDGSFDNSFHLEVRSLAGEPGWRELLLTARYRQGKLPADRFLIAVTEDGTDPRLSPTSRILTILARQGVEQWQAAPRVRADARPLRIAVGAAALTRDGLRAQSPLLPEAWQKPGL
jgi:hypothetical protein